MESAKHYDFFDNYQCCVLPSLFSSLFLCFSLLLKWCFAQGQSFCFAVSRFPCSGQAKVGYDEYFETRDLVTFQRM